MRRLWAVLLACILLCSLTACGDDGSEKGFLLPLNGEPRQLDPQSATESASVTVIAALFEGLTRLDGDGNVVDGAATYTLSTDGLTYTFTLKESYWSPLSIRGEKTAWDKPTLVTAQDFVFGWQRAVSPDNQSGTATAFYGIRNAEAVHEGTKPLTELGVAAISDTQLTVTLEKPDASFLTRLASTPFMPCNRAFFDYTAGRYGLEAKYLLSNGAFSLTAWNHNQSLLLNKNDGYHAADSVVPSAVRFVTDSKTPADALIAGQLDAAFLSTEKVDAAKQAGIQVQTLEDSVRSVYFNTAITPLSRADIRMALCNAIEWTTVYDYLTTVGESKATGYIPNDAIVDNTRYRTGDNAAVYSTQIDTAQALFKRGLTAAYPEDKSPTMPRLSMLAANDAVSADIARYILQSWQKNLKLSITLDLVSAETLAARVTGGNYQIALYTAIGGGLTAAENLTAFTSGAANNLTAFSDEHIDAVIAQAAHAGRDKVMTAESALRASCPSIPVSFPRRYYGVARNCQNVTVRPFGGGTYGGEYEFLSARKFDD